jgi:hypothetical protein
MECPRRAESFIVVTQGPDSYREDNTCSYCGSFNAEAFMLRIEAGDVKLTPTDKNYKVYVANDGGEGFKQTFRDCPQGATCTGPKDCTHWVTRDRNETKFYFQHLSEDQKRRFIELLNENKIKLEYPGHFYVLPFFCTLKTAV